jgi:hypothetical protein
MTSTVYAYGISERGLDADRDHFESSYPFFDGVEVQGDGLLPSFLNDHWELCYSSTPDDRDLIDDEGIDVIPVDKDITDRPELLASLIMGIPAQSKESLILGLFDADIVLLSAFHEDDVRNYVQHEFTTMGSLASSLSYTADDVIACIISEYITPLRIIGVQPFNDRLLRRAVIDVMSKYDHDSLFHDTPNLKYGALTSPVLGVYGKAMETIAPGYLEALREHYPDTSEDW